MTHFFKSTLFLSVLLICLSSCSTTEKTAKTQSDPPSIYPEWFTTAQFESDSTAFHGFATAVSSDSVIAMANAELQARANLETAIAYKMEEARITLEEEGNSTVKNADFILTLRNAHNQVQQAANNAHEEARAKGGYYTGFAQVTISKSDFLELMESGFSGKSSYWQTLSSSAAFQSEM
jgi:hypothetical protein